MNLSRVINDYFVQEPGRPLRIDITFYLKTGTVKSLEYLKRPNSPVEYKRSLDVDVHYLDAKNRTLDGTFVLGPTDSEILEEQEHAQAAKLLGFQPQSTLSYGKCFVNRDKLIAFREIMDYIASSGMNHHLRVQDEDGAPNLDVEFYMFIGNSDTGDPIFGIGQSQGERFVFSPGAIPEGLEQLVQPNS